MKMNIYYCKFSAGGNFHCFNEDKRWNRGTSKNLLLPICSSLDTEISGHAAKTHRRR